MKILALVVAFIIGLLFSAANAEEDEPPDTAVICPTDNPHCEEPWTQRPPVPSRPSHN